LIFSFSAQSRPLGGDLAPDYLAHFLEYALFGLTLAWALAAGRLRSLTPSQAGLGLLIASACGALDEFHQWFVPNRNASVRDWIADTVGAAALFAAALLIARFRSHNA
jgi:VanZ family protein